MEAATLRDGVISDKNISHSISHLCSGLLTFCPIRDSKYISALYKPSYFIAQPNPSPQ